MTNKDILNLSEGAHVVTINTERCLVVRLRDGHILATQLPERKLLIQRYSERVHLLREDRADDVFRPNSEEDAHEDIDCTRQLSAHRAHTARA